MNHQPNNEDSPDRPPVASAAAWASQIITISLEMAIPPVLGIWLDQRLGTRVLFLIIGCGLGMTVAGLQLMKIAQTGSSKHGTRRHPRDVHDQD